MKVKIQYTVELEDIPEEIERMLGEQLKKIGSACDTTRTNSVPELVTKIDTIRRQLYEADIRLEDLSHIASGYLQTKFGPASEEPESTREKDEID